MWPVRSGAGGACVLPTWLLQFVCPTEIVAFSDAAASFRDVGADIVGVSTDSHHTHLAWVKTPRSAGGVGGIQIPLVGDFSKTIAASFGVLVDDPTDDMYGSAMRCVRVWRWL